MNNFVCFSLCFSDPFLVVHPLHGMDFLILFLSILLKKEALDFLSNALGT